MLYIYIMQSKASNMWNPWIGQKINKMFFWHFGAEMYRRPFPVEKWGIVYMQMRSKLRNYISQQPQLPQGFWYKTPILESDRKGFTIRNACAQNEFPIESWCKAGARTSELVDIIQERIQKAIKRHNQIVI